MGSLRFDTHIFRCPSSERIEFEVSILQCVVNASLRIVDLMCMYNVQLLTNVCPDAVPKIPIDIKKKKTNECDLIEINAFS